VFRKSPQKPGFRTLLNYAVVRHATSRKTAGSANCDVILILLNDDRLEPLFARAA
jgi:hypothetical protein